MDILDIKKFSSKKTGSTLQPRIYEIGDINKMLQYF